MGPYQDSSNRALRYGPQAGGYTLETCFAACVGYEYFSLQYYTTNALSQCFCDDDLSHATKYGTASCDEYGGSWCNYIYQIVQGMRSHIRRKILFVLTYTT